MADNAERYKAMTRLHWRCFRASTPLVMVFVPVLFYVAAVKPL
jgi:hypothetical protein